MAPPPAPPPKIVLAALGPETLELAGEIADGVVLNSSLRRTLAAFP